MPPAAMEKDPSTGGPLTNSPAEQYLRSPAESRSTSDTASIPSSNPDSEKFAPIQTNQSTRSRNQMLTRRGTAGSRPLTDDEITRALSHRTSSTYQGGSEDNEEVARLVSRMFGRERKANSDEEQTRHQGVVWKNLTVKGVGLGAAIQPTNADSYEG
jgi:ATP-binding cassette subfamily G (WHITE) protein 2 (SNQ2)